MERTIPVPLELRGRSTTARAYRLGFRAGSIAAPGGVPLSRYTYPGLKLAYQRGFIDAQAEKLPPRAANS
jgi:hypothetical protein